MPDKQTWTVRFSEPRSESDPMLQGEVPAHLIPILPGEMLAIPLWSTPGVTLGSALRRKPEVLDAIRAVPGVEPVRLSPIGGTIGPGGPCWLELLILVRLPVPCPRPLDRLLGATTNLLQDPLDRFHVHLTPGRVEGAWCPGFSDLSVEGHKLVGIGFKLTGEFAQMRVIIGIRRPSAPALARLDACHRAFGPGVDPTTLCWLGELVGRPNMDRAAALRLIAGPARLGPEKIRL